MSINLQDKILEEYGISYEDLDAAERDTYNRQTFNLRTLTIADLIEKIEFMKDSISMQISQLQVITDEDKRKDDFLKARLQNYILLDAFLTAPDKAEKALRESLKNMKKVEKK